MTCTTCNAQLRELFTSTYCPRCDARPGEQEEPRTDQIESFGTLQLPAGSLDGCSTGTDIIFPSHR